MGMSMRMVLEQVGVGGKRWYKVAHSVTHSPFREEYKIGQACDDHGRDAAIQYSGQDLP